MHYTVEIETRERIPPWPARLAIVDARAVAGLPDDWPCLSVAAVRGSDHETAFQMMTAVITHRWPRHTFTFVHTPA